MVHHSPNDYLDNESRLFEEFDLDQDQILKEVIGTSPKSILNYENALMNEDKEDSDFRHFSYPQYDGTCAHIYRGSSKLINGQSYQKEEHPCHCQELHLNAAVFDNFIRSLSSSEQKSQDFIPDIPDEEFNSLPTESFLNLPANDPVDSMKTYSTQTCNDDSILPADTGNALNGVEIPEDLNVNPDHDVFDDAGSSVPLVDSRSPTICTPLQLPINLHSKSSHTSESTEKAVSDMDDIRCMKKKMENESHRPDTVPRIGERSPTTKAKARKIRNKPNKCYHLYDFIKEVLSGKAYPDHPRCVDWVDKEGKVFRIVNTTDFSRLWGEMKTSKSPKLKAKMSRMTYEKVSRTLRYYSGDKLKILEKVEGKKFHFKFGTGNMWSKHKM